MPVRPRLAATLLQEVMMMYHARHRYNAVRATVREQGGWKVAAAAVLAWVGFVTAVCAAVML